MSSFNGRHEQYYYESSTGQNPGEELLYYIYIYIYIYIYKIPDSTVVPTNNQWARQCAVTRRECRQLISDVEGREPKFGETKAQSQSFHANRRTRDQRLVESHPRATYFWFLHRRSILWQDLPPFPPMRTDDEDVYLHAVFVAWTTTLMQTLTGARHTYTHAFYIK